MTTDLSILPPGAKAVHVEPRRHIVVLGNPIDGLSFYGPFPTRQAAEAWAEMQNYEIEWWVAPLTRPIALALVVNE
jgi:hypothetical protein